ncbi:Glutamate receptor [Chionoecetes opilio]|uniref:Glutamate receptor n=1 Tax=Chionoecetes opilio TaxID=41210 RepID=A0A8J4Y0X9_CHIOP|nr:Glutamate receptor [Chionoecetes opilio]
MLAAYVDLKKVFDSVHRESLWDLLRLRGIPARTIGLITGLYYGTESAVKCGKPMVFTFNDETQGIPGCQGYAADLMRLLQRKLNFSEVILPVQGFGSVTNNGSWNGMVGELSRLKADLSPLDFSPSAERANVLDFGVTYSLDGVIILGQAPSLVSRPFLLLNIFSPLVCFSHPKYFLFLRYYAFQTMRLERVTRLTRPV